MRPALPGLGIRVAVAACASAPDPGFLSLLARTAGGTEAIAETRVETFELGLDAIDEMFEDHFPVLFGTMRWVADRLLQENLVAPPRPIEAVDAATGSSPAIKTLSVSSSVSSVGSTPPLPRCSPW